VFPAPSTHACIIAPGVRHTQNRTLLTSTAPPAAPPSPLTPHHPPRYIHRPLQYRSKTHLTSHISHQTRPKLALLLALLSWRPYPACPSPLPDPTTSSTLLQIPTTVHSTGQVRRIQGLSAPSETSQWGSCDQRFQNPSPKSAPGQSCLVAPRPSNAASLLIGSLCVLLTAAMIAVRLADWRGEVVGRLRPLLL
jgi:hypothetical protein